MNFRLICTLILTFLISSCSPFGAEKNTKKVMADGLSPKELYSQAEDQVNAGAIDDAIEKFKLILASYPGSKYAIQARLDIAFNYYKRKKYNLAINELDMFIKRYPSIAPTPYAYYLRGVIAEEKSASILDEIVTDIAQRDIEGISQAYDYYNLLIEKFPDSKYSKDASLRLAYLINILARHEFYVSVYYTRKDSNIAALNRLKFIIENYPDSSLIPDTLHLMAYNYEKINALDFAEDAQNILSLNFPNHIPNYSLKK